MRMTSPNDDPHSPGDAPGPPADEAAALDRGMMSRALELAAEAGHLGEVPVGALVVRTGRIIAQAYNLRETLRDPTAHAERLALTWAGRALGSWRLDACVLYVTLEPCAMCAGAIVLSRIARLVYGATDRKGGACESLYRLASDPRLNHRPAITSGVMAAECGEILTEFFQDRRRFRKLKAVDRSTPSVPAPDARRASAGRPPDPEGCLSG
jgi:tRNA(adenine34) deaminase